MSDLIFGRTWEEIQDMQQNRYKPKPIISKSPDEKTIKTALEFLKKYGIEKLKQEFYGYYDVLLQTNNLPKE